MEIARVGGMYSKSDRARGGKSLREIRFSDSAIKDVIHCNPRRISNHITIPSPLNFYNISFTTKKKHFSFLQQKNYRHVYSETFVLVDLNKQKMTQL